MTGLTAAGITNIQGNGNTNWSDGIPLSDPLMLRSGSWNEENQRRAWL